MKDDSANCYQCGRIFHKTYPNRAQYFCSKKCRQKHFNEIAKFQREERRKINGNDN